MSNAWNEGYDAAERGEPFQVNPYEEMTEEYEDWNEGYDDFRK